MFQKVFAYAGPYKKKTILAAAVIFLAVLMSVIPFIFVYQVIAPAVQGKPMTAGYISLRVLGVLICLALHACLYVKGLSLSHDAAYNILMHLRVSLQRRMENLPLGVIQAKGTGSIKRLFVDDVDSIEMLLAHALPEGFGNVAIPVVVYISMFFVDWKLALMSLASLPVGMTAMCAMYSIGVKGMKNYYEAGQVMNNTIIEYINGMEVVKVFNRDGESYERFERDIRSYRDFTLSWYKACWPWMAVYNSVLSCTLLLTLPLGSWAVLKGYSTLPDLILVMCLSLSIGIPLLKAMGFLPSLPQINYKISALEQMLDAEPLKQAPGKGFRGTGSRVVFSDVSFAYESDPAADHVSLTINEGEKTALVGESGSGKSTLAKLLVHYYDVTQGTITLGGQDITEMSLEALNDQIAYMAQEQYLFNIPLIENIRLGRPEATDAEVMDAAKRAQCMGFIEKLPKGIHTMPGDGGKSLSGGQRQRIAIARAILKDVPVVVLDEATAFTDPENEEKLEKAISEVVKGETLLVIAHRLSSVRNADQIYVMEKGHIAASGRHEQLLESCPEYRKLWDAAQASAKWKVVEGKEEERYA